MGSDESKLNFEQYSVYECNYTEKPTGAPSHPPGPGVYTNPIKLTYNGKHSNDIDSNDIFTNYDDKTKQYSVNPYTKQIYNYINYNEADSIGYIASCKLITPLSGGGGKQYYKGYYYNLHTVNKKQFIKTKNGQVSIAAVRAWQKRALK